MKKNIRLIDNDRGIMQVTSVDERFYAVPSQDDFTGLPVYEYLPSVSWIVSYDYMPKSLLEWAKKNGVDSDEIMMEAAKRGSRVHHAVEMIIKGETLHMDTPISDGEGNSKPLNEDEWEVIKSFVDWNDEVKPRYILSEKTVISKKHKYAGSFDCLCEIEGETWLLDFKTSKQVHTSHKLQLSAYLRAYLEETGRNEKIRIAVLQLGYSLNKKHWKFTEVEENFPRFLRVLETWKEENPDSKPRQINLPLSYKISNPLNTYETKTIQIPGDEDSGFGNHDVGGRSVKPHGSKRQGSGGGGHIRGKNSKEVR